MTPTLLTETTVMFRPGWPSHICPNGGGEHAFAFFMGTYVCDGCAAEVSESEAMSLWNWWGYIHRQAGENRN